MAVGVRAAVALTLALATAALLAAVGRASGGDRHRGSSLIYFAQIADPQITDEQSPARAELLHPAGGKLSTLWRRQEPLTTQVLDQAVRAVNQRLTSPVVDATGRRAPLALALVTGDLADNAQRNEVRWAVRTLDGARIDPFSGQRVGRRNRCPGAWPAAIRELNARVARRLYTGVSRSTGFWDPTKDPPLYPGLLDRAQRPFQAEGLRVPWYSVRGNHDALPQGMYGPRRANPRSLATGCRKVEPGATPVTLGWRGDPWAVLRARLRRKATALVPPDTRRRFLSSAAEYRALHGRDDARHGFGFTSRRELRASRGAATYYSFAPRPGLRFVALDTASDTSGPHGNLDHPQYRWLRRELRRAEDRHELVVIYGHHSLATLSNPARDERAGRFDRDPRPSRPLHLGTTGRANVRELLLRHPNVVLYLAGHTHRSQVDAHLRPDGSGFWQITTSSLVDAPQQVRLLELMRNGDGTVSILTTMVDHAGPLEPPPPGTAAADMAGGQLAGISRVLSARGGPLYPAARGAPHAELVVRDPLAR